MSLQVWMWWILGTLFGGTGAFLLCWGLFSDRLAGKYKSRRCRKCLYDMAAVVGLKCPECGSEGKREPAMHFSKRRWGTACVGLLAIAIAVLICLRSRGDAAEWSRILPIRTQLVLAPLLGRENVLLSIWGVPHDRFDTDQELTRAVTMFCLDVLKSPKSSFDELRYAAVSLARLAPAIPPDSSARNVVGTALFDFCATYPAHSHAYAGVVPALLILLGQERTLASMLNCYSARASDPISGPEWKRFAKSVFKELAAPFSDATMESIADLLLMDDPELSLPDSFPFHFADAFYWRLEYHLKCPSESRRPAVLSLLRKYQCQFRDAGGIAALRLLQELQAETP